MKILFLDDELRRHRAFKKLYFRHDVTYVLTIEEFKRELWQGKKFDYMSLDHDLEGKTFVPSGPGTGYEAAQLVTKLDPSIRPNFVVVHSYNEKGAKAIVSLLDSVQIESESLFFGTAEFTEMWDKLLEKKEDFKFPVIIKK